ncbi:MAG: hypothetical protein C4547_15860 [Phycisphaerales bacterium]|nr:MAG: hypothetical protein C4547_15860 [Phycisphaerales bacterium]
MLLAVLWLATVGTWMSCRRQATKEEGATTAPPPHPVPVAPAAEPSNGPDESSRASERPGTRFAQRPNDRDRNRSDDGAAAAPADHTETKRAEKSRNKRSRPTSDPSRMESEDGGKPARAGRTADALEPAAAVEFTRIPPWTKWDPPNAGDAFIMGFVLGGDATGRESARMAVTRSAGGEGRVQDVIDRLVERFAADPAPTVKRAELTASGMPIQLVDIVGLYQPDEDKRGRAEYRIYCAIVEYGGGLTTVKVMGPADAIEQHQDAILDMVRSARPR